MFIISSLIDIDFLAICLLEHNNLQNWKFSHSIKYFFNKDLFITCAYIQKEQFPHLSGCLLCSQQDRAKSTSLWLEICTSVIGWQKEGLTEFNKSSQIQDSLGMQELTMQKESTSQTIVKHLKQTPFCVIQGLNYSQLPSSWSTMFDILP